MIIDTLFNRPEYLEVVANMIHVEFIQKKQGTTTFEEVKTFLENHPNESYPVTFGALNDLPCVGTVSLFEHDLKERPAYSPWIASLVVENAYRSQGIGQQLIDQLIIYAKSRQIQTIYLKTDNASAYYKKLGWTLVETIETKDPPLHIFAYNIKEA